MRPNVFVVSTQAAEGERFAILRPGTLPFGSFLWSSSPEDRCGAIDQHLHTLGLLSEVEVRTRLAEMGLATKAVDDQIRRARHQGVLT